MAELTEKAGLPRPEIAEEAGCVVVRFRPSRYIPPRQAKQDLTRRQRRIFRVLSQRRRVAVRDIADRQEMESRPIRDDLALMKQLGLVENQGHGRGAVWLLVEAGIVT